MQAADDRFLAFAMINLLRNMFLTYLQACLALEEKNRIIHGLQDLIGGDEENRPKSIMGQVCEDSDQENTDEPAEEPKKKEEEIISLKQQVEELRRQLRQAEAMASEQASIVSELAEIIAAKEAQESSLVHAVQSYIQQQLPPTPRYACNVRNDGRFTVESPVEAMNESSVLHHMDRSLINTYREDVELEGCARTQPCGLNCQSSQPNVPKLEVALTKKSNDIPCEALTA